MTGRADMAVHPRPVPPRAPGAATAMLAQALTGRPREQLTGALTVTGYPGGVLHLRDGAVIAVETPGAPGAEAVLLRSGRVGEEDWADAFGAGAHLGRTAAELVDRGLTGAAELRVLCLMATLDGAFAIAAGRIDGCVLKRSGSAPELSLREEGVEPERLLLEIERRVRALAALPTPLSPHRDRLTAPARPAGPAPAAGSGSGAERREILLRANGRRTARDIAFLLGRGVYAVTVEASRMVHEGLLEVVPRRAIALPAPEPPPSPPPAGSGPPHLPRRSPGSSGNGGPGNGGGSAEPPPPRPAPGRRPLLRLRAAPRPEGGPDQHSP